MVFCFCGFLFLWFSGFVVLWFRGFVVDGPNEQYKINLKGKAYKLLYELNKDTLISPVSVTVWRETGCGFGQGTIEGAICTGIDLNKGVENFLSLSNSEYEMTYEYKCYTVLSFSFLLGLLFSQKGLSYDSEILHGVLTYNKIIFEMVIFRLFKKRKLPGGVPKD